MDLLYPELLTKEQLLSHLSVLKFHNLSKCTRDELIELYQKHIMPKPSRKKIDNDPKPDLQNKRQPIIYDGRTSASTSITKSNSQIDQASAGIHAISIQNTTNCSNIQRSNQRIVSLKRSQSDGSSASPASKRQKITWP